MEEARQLALKGNATKTLLYEITSLGFLGAAAIEREDDWAATWVFQEIGNLSTRIDEANIAGWGASLVNSVGQMVEAHLKALDNVIDSSVVSRIEWRDLASVRRLRLPRKQQAALEELSKKVSVELVAEDRVITPRANLEAELRAELVKVLSWHEVQIDRWAELVTTEQNERGKASEPILGAWCLAGLAVGRRLCARGQDERGRKLARESIPHVMRCYDELDADVKTDMLDAVEDLTIKAIEVGDNALLRNGLFSLSVLLSRGLGAIPSKEPQELIPPNARLAGVFAYAHLSAELDADEARHAVIREVLQHFTNPVATLAFWLSMSRDPWMEGSSQLIFRFGSLARHFRDRIEALPKTIEGGEGWMGLDEVAEHRSELVRDLSRGARMSFWEADDLLEALKDWYEGAGSATAAD